jgi:hypothetical protein
VRNVGYKSFKSGDGDRGRSLKFAIDCLYYSLEIYARYKLPERWVISRETLDIFKCLRDEDLHDTDLTGANLRGADLTGANLSGADLRGANLIEATFTNSIVVGTKFEDTSADYRMAFSKHSYNSSVSIATS